MQRLKKNVRAREKQDAMGTFFGAVTRSVVLLRRSGLSQGKGKKKSDFSSNEKIGRGGEESPRLNLSSPLFSKNKPRHTPPSDPTNF